MASEEQIRTTNENFTSKKKERKKPEDSREVN